MRRLLLLLCSLLCVVSALPFSVSASDGYNYPEPEVLQIDLLLQPSRYLKMIHSEEKQKFDAVVCMNEGKPQQIGVQVRGATSLHTGLKTASKRIPMELCFDYADPNGAFSGNPSLTLINCTTPARLITQAVAMQAFEFLDIPTPRMTPAFIRINDTDFGLYLAVEDLNEAFMLEHFGGGSLYRPFSEDKDERTKNMPSFESIEIITKVDNGGIALDRFIQAQNMSDNKEAFLDIDEFLRYSACEAFVANTDGFLKNSSNFYLADVHDKLILLPWDTDEVFRSFADLESIQQIEQHSNLLFRELMQNDAYFAQYRQYIRKLNDEFLNPDTFLPWLENYIRGLAPYFQRDMTLSRHPDDVVSDLTAGNELYSVYRGNLLLTFQTYHDQLDAQFADESKTFYVPQGMYVNSNWTDDGETSYYGSDHSIIFRVCSGYWRLRRQAVFQSGDHALLWISGLFVFVFFVTVLSVYRPKYAWTTKCWKADK